ncbi:hypothetical protein N7507_001969 [Penicillium longicatenatum]|nr:hypothetical protein N7507_001969 [Penicillium longicatenatum]
MIPLAVGFPLGSSIAAKVIKRTGTYKIASIAGCTIMAMSTTLMAIRWPQGPHLGDLIYEFTHGIGSGILLIATFVGLSATVPSSNTTVAFTIYHLCQQLGILMGTSATSASTQAVFRQLLARQLGNGKDALEVSGYRV